MTPTEIIYQHRLAFLAHGKKNGNVAETCRIFGISRKTYYEWRKLADNYDLEALVPKRGRRPALANEKPAHVVSELLTLAVTEPLADHVLSLVPLSMREARELVGSLRLSPWQPTSRRWPSSSAGSPSWPKTCPRWPR